MADVVDPAGDTVRRAAACAAFIEAAQEGNLSPLQQLMSINDAAELMAATDEEGSTGFMHAAWCGHVEAMRLLLGHPSANAPAMMMQAESGGSTALVLAAQYGHVDAMRLLLDHPSADASAMMMHEDGTGWTALMWVAQEGHVDAMRLLLDHPLTEPAAMMTHSAGDGTTALIAASRNGHVDAVRLLLDHPSAATSAMTAFSDALPPSCAPLLFLLRRVAMQPQPCDAQEAHMSRVMVTLMAGPRSGALFDDNQPDDVRDECIRLLLEFGARGFDFNRPCVMRIVRELAALARVPQLLNKAVVGAALAQQQRLPRH
ncbi:hypothetical protein FOA52_000963 [Chlamydomonas sp. UWO 241]|nr:hypothetical protein FOA52_000963 [Chlamydomonas sp. UWO 241]